MFDKMKVVCLMETTNIDANLVSTLQTKDSSPKQSASHGNFQARLISTHHALASPLYGLYASLVAFFLYVWKRASVKPYLNKGPQSDERRAIPPLGIYS
jgi:hypothetical protein